VPEGDTIHRAAAALARALVGRKVTRFETAYAQLARVADDTPIAGRTVESVWAEGKHLLMRFSGSADSGPLTLRTHMRMSGSWHIYRPGQRWQRSRRDLRVLVATEAYEAVAFSVPVAEFLDERALERAPALGRLGPDLLAEHFDAAEALRRFRARPGEPVSELLLDQSVVAGAGNIFRSEALFVAGVDPAKPAGALTDAQLGELIATARRLMQANTGATASGGIVTYGRRRTTGRVHPGDALWVYGRGNRPCRRCGTPIAYRKTGINARGLYYCPVCQR
jgi:endonuclease VIII